MIINMAWKNHFETIDNAIKSEESKWDSAKMGGAGNASLLSSAQQ